MRKTISILLAAVMALSLFVFVPATAEAATSVTEGNYYLQSALGKTLDVAGASTVSGANVQIYTLNKTKAQQFKVQKVSGNQYKIVNVRSGKVLDVAGGRKTNKANVRQYNWNGTKAQLWTFEAAGGGYYYLKNAGSGKVLDVAGGRTANKTNVQQYQLNKSKAQKWKLVKVQQSSSNTSKYKKTLPDGRYMFSILDSKREATPLEVDDGSKKDKANVQLGEPGDYEPDFWDITYLNNGYYKILNAYTGKALDVSGGRVANKRNIQQYKWNGTKSQQWAITKEGKNQFAFRSALDPNYVLSISDGKIREDQNAELFKYSGKKWQLFNAWANSPSTAYQSFKVNDATRKYNDAEERKYPHFYRTNKWNKKKVEWKLNSGWKAVSVDIYGRDAKGKDVSETFSASSMTAVTVDFSSFQKSWMQIVVSTEHTTGATSSYSVWIDYDTSAG